MRASELLLAMLEHIGKMSTIAWVFESFNLRRKRRYESLKNLTDFELFLEIDVSNYGFDFLVGLQEIVPNQCLIEFDGYQLNVDMLRKTQHIKVASMVS